MTPRSAAALSSRTADVVVRWLDAYGRSTMRVPRRVDLSELGGMATGIADALGHGMSEPDATPGAAHLREAEKRIAFAGGWLATSGATAFDVAALVGALRDVLVAEAPEETPRLRELFDWFAALALEGFATSREDASRLRYQDSLEKGSPLVQVTPDLPALFLVGDPEKRVLETLLGRMVMMIVRAGAKAILLDVSGLGALADAMEPLAMFGAHKKLAGVTVIVVGSKPDDEPALRDALAGAKEVVVEERFDTALAHGLELSGSRLARRS
jgi:hypothetical protein